MPSLGKGSFTVPIVTVSIVSHIVVKRRRGNETNRMVSGVYRRPRGGAAAGRRDLPLDGSRGRLLDEREQLGGGQGARPVRDVRRAHGRGGRHGGVRRRARGEGRDDHRLRRRLLDSPDPDRGHAPLRLRDGGEAVRADRALRRLLRRRDGGDPGGRASGPPASRRGADDDELWRRDDDRAQQRGGRIRPREMGLRHAGREPRERR